MTSINPRRVEQQLRNFERALDAYQNNEPLSRFLARFFKENKQMGSSDRRTTSRFCYNYFRLGAALTQLKPSERLLIAEFLCEEASDLVGLQRSEWAEQMGSNLSAKIDFLQQQGIAVAQAIFPFEEALSPEVDKEAFVQSHLVQPDLFIRVQRQAIATVENELTANGIPFEKVADCGYKLPNRTNLQALSKIEGFFEVQDLSSQQSLDLAQVDAGASWWDACAASGGKSLLLLHKQAQVNLLVSDIRLSILRNLDERFLKARIATPYRKKIVDLSQDAEQVMRGDRFDGIILDAPCTGSGTWGRTPEMMQQFSSVQIQEFAALQKQIAQHAIPFLKTGGQFIYITCSVFAQENEEVVAYLQQSLGMRLESMNIIPGYNKKADSMFAARLTKI